MSKIAIVDYGVGNLYSIQKLLDFLDIGWVVTGSEKDFKSCSGIILPGVGAFADAMREINEKNLDEIIRNEVNKGKTLIGICLGMQLLFTRGNEGGECKGLNLISGNIEDIPKNQKVPHTGWNSIERVGDCKLVDGISSGDNMYFVHSYYAIPEDTSVIKAYTNYGVQIPALLNKDNIYGTQFHPEKSGSLGIKIINNLKEMLI